MEASSRKPLGQWIPEIASEPPQWLTADEALDRMDEPIAVVQYDDKIRYAAGGSCHYGSMGLSQAFPLLAHIPAVPVEQLGGGSFCQRHGLRYPCHAGSMAFGISSVALVTAMGKAGMLGFYGSGGMALHELDSALETLSKGKVPWGANLLHRLDDPAWEETAVDLFIKHKLPFVEASAFLRPTAPLVRLRLQGLHEDAQGHIRSDHTLFVKLSRVEVASYFVKPPPERIVKKLLEEGKITAQEAQLASRIPMAENITVEADSGGHTDHRAALTVFPTIKSAVERITREEGYGRAVHVGLGGGIATPVAAAAAFTLGAAYVVTGSVNQAALESGTSPLVKEILAGVKETDLRNAPAADLFERGGSVQVVGKGLRFAERAQKLYDGYCLHDSVGELPESFVSYLEREIFRETLEDAWLACEGYLKKTSPKLLERAVMDKKFQMALLFRSYLGQAVRWALEGNAERRDDFQIWCGPSMGAFNAWAQGSYLQEVEKRSAPDMALQFLTGAARLIRLQLLRCQGIDPCPAPEWFKARPQGSL